MGALNGGVAVGIPADRHLSHPDLARQSGGPARCMPGIHQLLIGFNGDQMIAQRRECLDGLLARYRHADRERNVGDVPDAGRVDLEVITLPVGDLAAEQLADDLNGFAQHVVPALDRRPPATHHMLVQVLPAAQAEGESAVGEDLWYHIVGHVT